MYNIYIYIYIYTYMYLCVYTNICVCYYIYIYNKLLKNFEKYFLIYQSTSSPPGSVNIFVLHFSSN